MPITYDGTQYSGIWTMQQVNSAISAGTWPSPPAPHLFTWGNNYAGGLGLGNITNYSSPKQVGSLTTWLNVAAGVYSSFVVKTDGSLWAWGNSYYGQLGLGTSGVYYSSPKQVGSLTNWSIVSNNGYSTFAIKTNGTLWSWGNNGTGELGLGNTTLYSSPKQVGSLTSWSNVFPNGYSTLALKTDGTLWSWGYNNVGQLGLGNTTNYSSPKQIGALTVWANVSSASSAVSVVALKTDGTIWSWGYNTQGQLGLGNTTYYSSPKQIGALTTWTNVTGFARALMAIKGGTLWSWGKGNNYGTLGLGNTTSYSSPMQVGLLTNWLSVSGGFYTATSVKTDGTLWVWGRNEKGQLGLNNLTPYSSPKQVGSLTSWLKVACGYNNTIAIAST